VASFFKNNDVGLRSLNKALRTLAWEVATQQPSFAAEAEQFCLKEEPTSNYAIWVNLFLTYFTQGSSANTTCLVIDGIDEAEPQEQENLFNFLGKAFSETHIAGQTASLRIVLLSRDSVRSLVGEHSLEWVPEIEVGDEQTKDDLHQYISQELQKTKLFRGYPDLLEEVIHDIKQKAEGLWEWVNPSSNQSCVVSPKSRYGRRSKKCLKGLVLCSNKSYSA
jgi:hypothetical protein